MITPQNIKAKIETLRLKDEEKAQRAQAKLQKQREETVAIIRKREDDIDEVVARHYNLIAKRSTFDSGLIFSKVTDTIMFALDQVYGEHWEIKYETITFPDYEETRLIFIAKDQPQ
jgi:hypothetical protein